MQDRRTKVAVVGAGSVGSTLAYAILMRGAAHSVALYDLDARKVEAQALDIAHGIQFMDQADIRGSADVGVCAGADVVVVTAGARQRPGQSRMELAEATVGLTRSIMPQLMAVAPEAVYVMVTNPVDVVTRAALSITGLPPRQLFGSGTVLDSSRLRYLVAEHCGVAVANVHAYIVGEHGDSEIPLWSSATIGGVPLLQWQEAGLGEFDADVRRSLAREVVTSAYTIIEGKGATNFAIAVAGTRIVEAVLGDQDQILPISTMLSDYEGIDGVCLSVPTIVNRHGAGARLPLLADETELAGLHASARALAQAAEHLGL